MRAGEALLETVAATWAWLALAAALLALLVGAWLALRRRRFPVRRRHLRRSTPRYPVVLAHGLLGFDEIRLGGARHDYFRGVSARLEREGCVVHRCRVARTASIAERVASLTTIGSPHRGTPLADVGSG